MPIVDHLVRGHDGTRKIMLSDLDDDFLSLRDSFSYFGDSLPNLISSQCSALRR